MIRIKAVIPMVRLKMLMKEVILFLQRIRRVMVRNDRSIIEIG